MLRVLIADPGSLTKAVGVLLLLPMRPEPLEVAAALVIEPCQFARLLASSAGLDANGR